MIEMPLLWLAFLLGLRHALDPDHIAVIDNIVFRTADARPRLAPWTGSFFALGHSLSVGAVAIGVALFASTFTMPQWIASVVDSAVIFLLLVVGSLNLAALLNRREYTPVGWRASLVPVRLRANTHPFAIVLIGIVFGLVFDTATQAAAWGAAATAKGGTIGAIVIASAFAAGMLLTDTADSQIVARLLRNGGRSASVMRRYRRAVGWVVVLLSYGMAAYALAELAGVEIALSDIAFSTMGIAAAAGIVFVLAIGRLMGRSRHAVPRRRI